MTGLRILIIWAILQGIMLICQRFGLPMYCTGLVATLILVPLVLQHKQNAL